jgi:hypothetical protein
MIKAALFIASIGLATGCVTPSDSYQIYLDQQVSIGEQALHEAAEKSLMALICGRKYADENWTSGTPTEIGDASLSGCSAELNAYSRATLRANEVKAAIAASDANSLSRERNTAAILTRDDVDQKRSDIRASVIRRALELRSGKK